MKIDVDFRVFDSKLQYILSQIFDVNQSDITVGKYIRKIIKWYMNGPLWKSLLHFLGAVGNHSNV